MDLLHTWVSHKTFGHGKIIAQAEKALSVEFYSFVDDRRVSDVRKFVYNLDTFRKYLTADDADVQAAILLDTLRDYPSVELDGKTYWRKGELSWIDIDARTADAHLSKDIEAAYFRKLRKEELEAIAKLPIEILFLKVNGLCSEINRLQGGRAGNDVGGEVRAKAYKAIDYLEIGIAKLGYDKSVSEQTRIEILRKYLPMLSARYRNIGEPNKCLTEILNKYKHYGNEVLNHEFFTSLAATHCDMGDLDGAQEAFGTALSLCPNRNALPLQNVEMRICAMIDERDRAFFDLDVTSSSFLLTEVQTDSC